MRKLFLSVLFIMISISSFSQSKSFKISATLLSNEDKSPLEAATVYLQRVKDSALITYTISDQNGNFVLESKTSDKVLNLYVSYIGYNTLQKKIELNQEKIELGNLLLTPSTNILDEVVVKSTAPITIKKDTLEFNVKSFKTKKDANIEDLLKELPGVEVDQAGKIKINGKEVNKILVNGKEFFGNDPTIATKNLSKDIIEKIQVSETKTDAQAFAGEEGDNTNKTINLVVKKENNKGAFGRFAAGLGTDDRYEAAGMYNKFNNDLHLSVLAATNNINSPGFSYGEISKIFGGNSSGLNNQVFGNNNEGIVISKNAGLNFSDNWGKKVAVSTNYFFSNSDSENEIKYERENILPENRFFTNSNSNSLSNIDNHTTQTKLNIKLDSTLLINIEPNFRNTNGSVLNSTAQESLDENNTLINSSSSNSMRENIENEFSNNLNITKRLGKKGSFLKLNFNNRNIRANSTDLFRSEVDIFGDTPDTISRNLNNVEERDEDTYIANLRYRVPIKGKQLSIDFKYNYRNTIQNSLINAFDFNDITQQFNNTINNELSSDFKYLHKVNRPGIGLNYKKKKWTSSLIANLLYRTLENTDNLRPSFDLRRNFNALAIKYRLNYRSQTKSLAMGYDLSKTPAQLSQLQTVVNITNPLDIVTGNPDLLQTSGHRFYTYFNTNNFQKGTGINAYISSYIEDEKVIAKRTINEDLVRETTYANVNGSYNLYTNVGYNKKVKVDSVKTISLRTGIGNSITRSVNFYNGVQYANLSNSILPEINARFVWKKVTEIDLGYRFTYTENKYNIGVFEDQNFSFHRVRLNTTNHFSKKFDLRNQVSYTYNPNIADGFNRSAFFWNATLAYSFLKDKATLTLKAYDLLNQNTDARRITNQNYIEDRQSTVLQRYFMLSFSWKFNTLGKSGEIRNNRGNYIIR